MLGTSTAAMATNDTVSSGPTKRRHRWYGTTVVIAKATMPSTIQTAWRLKYVQLDPSRCSAVTDDAESTITRPSRVRTATTATSR
jgi:hypothetical protein